MFNGFQTSINGSCVMLLFQPWVLNSTRSASSGASSSYELLVKAWEVVRRKLLKARKLRPKDKRHKMRCNLLLAILYMAHMTAAYFAMLVMTYETGLFVSLIAGFGAGFMLFKNVSLDITEEHGAWRFKNLHRSHPSRGHVVQDELRDDSGDCVEGHAWDDRCGGGVRRASCVRLGVCSSHRPRGCHPSRRLHRDAEPEPTEPVRVFRDISSFQLLH